MIMKLKRVYLFDFFFFFLDTVSHSNAIRNIFVIKYSWLRYIPSIRFIQHDRESYYNN